MTDKYGNRVDIIDIIISIFIILSFIRVFYMYKRDNIIQGKITNAQKNNIYSEKRVGKVFDIIYTGTINTSKSRRSTISMDKLLGNEQFYEFIIDYKLEKEDKMIWIGYKLSAFDLPPDLQKKKLFGIKRDLLEEFIKSNIEIGSLIDIYYYQDSDEYKFHFTKDLIGGKLKVNSRKL